MLPIFQSDDKNFSLMQTTWAKQINPVINNPLNGARIIQNVALVTGSVNIINHLLGANLQGWFATRLSAQATLWDTQAVNPTPGLTLYLNTSANCTVNIAVF